MFESFTARDLRPPAPAPVLLLSEVPIILRHHQMAQALMQEAKTHEESKLSTEEEHIILLTTYPVSQLSAEAKRAYLTTQTRIYSSVASLDTGDHPLRQREVSRLSTCQSEEGNLARTSHVRCVVMRDLRQDLLPHSSNGSAFNGSLIGPRQENST